MKKLQKQLWRGLSGILCTAMVASGVSPAFTVRAEAPVDEVWQEISGIMDTFADKAVWTNTNYNQAITQQMPSTALLGNGDIGVTSYGNAKEKTWLLSSNDFWTDNSQYFGYVGRSPQLITGGGLTIAPAQAGHEYNVAYGGKATASSEARDHAAGLTTGGVYIKNLNGDGQNFTGWEAASAETPQWLLYDFMFQVKMDRIVIRHDNYTSKQGTGRNTRDFTVQTLKAGVKPEEALEEDWISVKEVVNNEGDSTDIKLDTVQEVRYLRIQITKATAEEEDGIARIGQLEAYYQNDEYHMPVIDNKGSEHPYNKVYEMPAYASSQTEGHEAGKAVGGVKQAEGWVSEVGQQQYLVVDLKVSTIFNRWQVKHDNYTSRKGQERNTVNFDLQISMDGQNWVTADSVTDNKEDVTDRRLLYDHAARYVRLNITKASGESDSAARARISQFELYKDDNYGTSYATEEAGASATASCQMNGARSVNNILNNNWFTTGNGGNDYCGWVTDTIVKPHWAQVDLGQERTFDELAILHTGLQAQMDDLAATGNKNAPGYKKFTTSAYKVSVSKDGESWDTVDDIKGNTASIYDRKLGAPVTARYIRIDITKGEQSGNDRARILKLYAFNNEENPLYSMPLEFTPEEPEPEPDPGPEAVAPEEAQYNLAYKAQVSVSSQKEGCEGKKAVSGVYRYTDETKSQAFEGWVSEAGQEQYLQLNFEEMIQFNRWQVKHHNSTTKSGSLYNTKDFQLEISRDGSKWVTIDSVKDNQEDITDRRMLYPVSAKAVRLKITRASGESEEEARARISQFELYLDEDFKNSLTMADQVDSVTVSSDPYNSKDSIISDNFIKPDKNGINDYNGWISLHAAMPQWAQIDLGEVKAFDEIGILLAGAEALVQDLAAGGAANADNSSYTDEEGNVGYRRFRAKKFSVSISSDEQEWEQIADYTDNREGQVSIQLPQNREARYIKILVTQGQQTPVSDQRARIAKVYAFNNEATPNISMPVEEYPVYVDAPVSGKESGKHQLVKTAATEQEAVPLEADAGDTIAFREEMDIAKAEIRTTMELGEVPVEMVNWLSAEKNLMITTITSNGAQDQTVDISPWGKNTLAKTTSDTNLMSKPKTIAQSGVWDNAVWATRKSNVEDEVKKGSDGTETVNKADWMSEFAIASKILGGKQVKYAAQDNEGVIRVTVPAGESITVVTAIDCAPNQKPDAPDGEKGQAVGQVLEILDQIQSPEDVEKLHGDHLDWWKNYYKLSYVNLGDTSLNRLYYGSQYIFGCCTREGEQAPGLYGVWTTRDNSGWQGDYHLNYNFQAPYYGSYSSNRLKEFSQPMFDTFIHYMDTGLERAANPDHLKAISSWYYGMREEDFKNGFEDALLYPVGLIPYKVTSSSASYLNQTIDALFCASQICAYYNYTLDREWLMKKQPSASGNLYSPYDFLVKTANFYEQWVEKRGARIDQEFVKDNPCSDSGGQSQTVKYTANYAKYPEYDGTGDYTYVLFDGAHEGSFEFNPNVTVGNVKNLLDTLVGIGKAAAPSEGKFAIWEDITTHLPGMEVSIYEYQGFNTNSIKNSQYLGKEIFGLSEDRKIRPISATVNMENVHPGDQLGFDSDPYLLEVARNTVNVCGNDGSAYGNAGWNMVNNTPKIFTHAARVQYDAAALISKIKQFAVNKMGGNYYVDDNTHGWEKVGIAEALNDMMVYSDNGFIKTFPTWTGADASFTDIRVKGALLVSSELENGQVPYIRVKSEQGTQAKVVIPWGKAYVTDEEGLLVGSKYGETENSGDTTIEFDTKEGKTYTVRQLGGDNDELLEILESMLKAAEDARAAAEEAKKQAGEERSLAQAAQEKASQERIAAEEAQKKAEEERAAAETAKNKAESERLAAESARRAAEEAQAAAEEARNDAETDKEAAAEAQKKAEEAWYNAQEAERQAAESLAAAEEARKNADSAAEDARTAKAEAETARVQALEAQAKAETAQREAEAAREEAAQLKAAAEEARKQAEAERKAAEEAKKQAEEERRAAEEAKKQAEEERKAAEEASKKAEEERKAAEEAQKQVEEERKAAEEARKQAEALRQAAEEAERKAEEERKAAEEAGKNAEAERAAAEEARRKAAEEKAAAEAAREQAELAEKKVQEARKAVEEALKKAEAAQKAAEEAQKKLEEAGKQKFALVKGRTYKKGSFQYKVKSVSKSGAEVVLAGITNKNLKKAVVLSEVTINGTTCKVVEIGAKAFKNHKKLTKVNVGGNVEKIGSQAFYGVKNLKDIRFNTKKLKSAGSKAFSGISSRAVIRVPKEKKKVYSGLLKGKGQKKTVKIK